MAHVKDTRGFLWWLPPAPKAPDYSTPEAITREARKSLHGWARTCYALLKTNGKVYREFQAALARHPQGDS